MYENRIKRRKSGRTACRSPSLLLEAAAHFLHHQKYAHTEALPAAWCQTPDRQKWYLEGFYTDYSLLKIKITDLPPRAAYVENPSDLVFDTKLPVVPQYEHIFDDEENVQRLPSAVRESGMRVQLFDGALQQTRQILESDYIWNKISINWLIILIKESCMKKGIFFLFPYFSFLIQHLRLW